MAERYNNIIDFDELSSTNDYAMELVQHSAVEEFTVVRTQFQTSGRGQRGNCWTAERGKNLLFSVILRPTTVNLHEQFILSQAVSLAILGVVAEFCENCHIKWPNDIYVGNRKIAGILIETNLLGKQIQSAVIGVGFNVNQTEFEEAKNPTSLSVECGREFQPNEILEKILAKFRMLYELVFTNPEQIRQQYLKKLYRYNQLHRFADKSGEFCGVISAVNPDGQLIIHDEAGKKRAYYFKEVEYII